MTDAEALAALLGRTDRASGNDGCWTFTGARNEWGYGLVHRRGRTMHAHRFVYTMMVGQIPDGHLIRHSCHNPACVNPAHLSTGTNADNAADKMAAGRHAAQRGTMRAATGARHGSKTRPDRWHRGGDSARADFTNEQACRIRHEYASGATQRELAETYGVHVMTINKLVRGATYPDAGGPIARRRAFKPRGHAASAAAAANSAPSTTQR